MNHPAKGEANFEEYGHSTLQPAPPRPAPLPPGRRELLLWGSEQGAHARLVALLVHDVHQGDGLGTVWELKSETAVVSLWTASWRVTLIAVNHGASRYVSH